MDDNTDKWIEAYDKVAKEVCGCCQRRALGTKLQREDLGRVDPACSHPTPRKATFEHEDEEDCSNSGGLTAIGDANRFTNQHNSHSDSHADKQPAATNRIDQVPLQVPLDAR